MNIHINTRIFRLKCPMEPQTNMAPCLHHILVVIQARVHTHVHTIFGLYSVYSSLTLPPRACRGLQRLQQSTVYRSTAVYSLQVYSSLQSTASTAALCGRAAPQSSSSPHKGEALESLEGGWVAHPRPRLRRPFCREQVNDQTGLPVDSCVAQWLVTPQGRSFKVPGC